MQHGIRQAIVESDVREAEVTSEDFQKMSKARALSFLHKSLEVALQTKKIHSDETWAPIKNLYKILDPLDGSLGNGEYYGGEPGAPDGKRWRFYIPHAEGKEFTGVITASFGPSSLDPTTKKHRSDKYDIIYTVSYGKERSK